MLVEVNSVGWNKKFQKFKSVFVLKHILGTCGSSQDSGLIPVPGSSRTKPFCTKPVFCQT